MSEMTILCLTGENPTKKLASIQEIDSKARLEKPNDGESRIIIVPDYNALLNSRETTGGSNTHPRRFCV